MIAELSHKLRAEAEGVPALGLHMVSDISSAPDVLLSLLLRTAIFVPLSLDTEWEDRIMICLTHKILLRPKSGNNYEITLKRIEVLLV